MSNLLDDPLAAITILTPSVVALVGVGTFLVSHLGLSRRIRTTEYYQKRLALLTTIMTEHRNTIKSETVSALEGEIESLAVLVLNLPRRIEEDPFLDWNHRTKWKRILSLPKPRSLAAWFLTICFSSYLAFGILFLSLVPISDSAWEPLMQALFWFFICGLLRYGSVKVWRLGGLGQPGRNGLADPGWEGLCFSPRR